MDFDSIKISDWSDDLHDEITVYYCVSSDHWLAKTWRGDSELTKNAVEYTLFRMETVYRIDYEEPKGFAVLTERGVYFEGRVLSHERRSRTSVEGA